MLFIAAANARATGALVSGRLSAEKTCQLGPFIECGITQGRCGMIGSHFSGCNGGVDFLR